jgi:hypothetical protein
VFNFAVIPPLVHIAIQGVSAAQPYKVGGEVIQAYDPIAARQRERSFGWVVMALALTAAASNVCFIRFLRTSAAAAVRRVVYGVAFAVCLLAGAGLSLWVRFVGLDAVSPFIAQTQFMYPWHHWLGVALLLGLACAVAAGRILLVPDAGDETAAPLVWRTNSVRYWNENRLVLLLLGAANLAAYVASGYAEWPWILPLEPESAGRIAVVWLCLLGLVAGRDEVGERLLHCSVLVRPACLLTTWLALLTLVLVSVEAFIWSNFAALTVR